MEKKYSVIMDKDVVVGVEVNGKRYGRPSEISRMADRNRVQILVESLSDPDEVLGPAAASQGPPKIIAGLVWSIAILMLAMAALSAFFTADARAKEQSAPGQVVSLTTRKDLDGTAYAYPVVEFLAKDETRQTVQLSQGRWPPAYTIGQQVTVRYHPDQPTSARIQSPGSSIGQWLVTIVTGLMGIAFLSAALLLDRKRIASP